MIYSDAGTIIPCKVVSLKSLTCSHHGSHTWHDFHIIDSFKQFVCCISINQSLCPEEIHIPFNCFFPSLSTLQLIYKPSVLTYMNILLIIIQTISPLNKDPPHYNTEGYESISFPDTYIHYSSLPSSLYCNLAKAFQATCASCSKPVPPTPSS